MVRVMRVTVPTPELLARLNVFLRRPPSSPPMTMAKLRRLLANPHFIMATAIAQDSERRIVGFAAMNLFEGTGGWVARLDDARAAVGWTNRGVAEALLNHLRLEAESFGRKEHVVVTLVSLGSPEQAEAAVA